MISLGKGIENSGRSYSWVIGVEVTIRVWRPGAVKQPCSLVGLVADFMRVSRGIVASSRGP
jgi:hypothetical protein